MQAPGGEDFKDKGWSFEFDRGEDGNQFKLDETMSRRRAADRPADRRELRRRVAEPRGSDLVDQINLMIFPVVLGTGQKVFEEAPERRRRRLKESKVVGEGVVVLVYERADAA